MCRKFIIVRRKTPKMWYGRLFSLISLSLTPRETYLMFVSVLGEQRKATGAFIAHWKFIGNPHLYLPPSPHMSCAYNHRWFLHYIQFRPFSISLAISLYFTRAQMHEKIHKISIIVKQWLLWTLLRIYVFFLVLFGRVKERQKTLKFIHKSWIVLVHKIFCFAKTNTSHNIDHVSMMRSYQE